MSEYKIQALDPEPEGVPETPVVPEPGPQWQWVWPLLRKTQRYSAYGFSAFAGLHLLSTAVLPVGSRSAADSTFMFARSIYQSSWGEYGLVFGTLGAHLLSGWALHLRRLYITKRNYGKISWSMSPTAISGVAVTALLIGHVCATRIGPIVKLGDSSLISLDYITWGLHHFMGKTAPALALIFGAYSFHALNGMNTYMKWGLRKTRIWALWGLSMVSLILSLRALALAPAPSGWIAEQYELAHSFMP